MKTNDSCNEYGSNPPELVHQVSLATIHREFAQVVTAAALLDLLIGAHSLPVQG